MIIPFQIRGYKNTKVFVRADIFNNFTLKNDIRNGVNLLLVGHKHGLCFRWTKGNQPLVCPVADEMKHKV